MPEKTIKIEKLVKSYPGINIKSLPDNMTIGQLSKAESIEPETISFRIPKHEIKQEISGDLNAEDLVGSLE